MENNNKIEKKYNHIKFFLQFWATITIGTVMIYWTLISLEKGFLISFLPPAISFSLVIFYFIKFTQISNKYLKLE